MIDWKSWQIVIHDRQTATIFLEKLYCLHGVKKNQNKETDKVVVKKIKKEIDLEISPWDNDCTHKIDVPNKDKKQTHNP